MQTNVILNFTSMIMMNPKMQHDVYQIISYVTVQYGTAWFFTLELVIFEQLWQGKYLNILRLRLSLQKTYWL